MTHNTNTLRGILFDELISLRAGSSEPRKAAAVAKLAQQIISTAKVEMDYHRLMMQAKEKGEELALGSMTLGTDAVPAVEHSKPPSIAAQDAPR